MFDTREVKVDLDCLTNAKKAYDVEIQNLKDACTQVNHTIELMRDSKWKSEGADAFFRSYDQNWKQKLDDHIEYLEHLRDCLQTACTGFYEAYNKNIFHV